MTIEIADRLVKLRKKYGYSQEELADKLGLSRQAVSKWERAEASPDTDNLICLAKLYGVSLDELLATDEDIDTIVKEQVKDEEKKENSESNDQKEEKKQDRVVINDKGVFLSDKNGERVTINDDGVTCYDKNGNVVKKVGKGEHDRGMAVIGAIEGVLFLLAAVGFILLGSLLDLWSSAWIVFFIPEIICSIARCIRKKNPNMFNTPFFCCFIFFFVCMFLPALVEGMPELWHPMWVVFLFIPIYHSICGAFHTALSKEWKEDPNVKADIDFTRDDDDDDDDDDDEPKTVNVNVNATINNK